MRTALLGYTGFVGSNIADQYEFTDYYNSSNIRDICGKKYDLIVSAANRAEMWRINQEPEKDLDEINDFIDCISQVQAEKFVLISTVGVYKDPNGANEDTSIDTVNLTPYGKNRFHLEEFCRNKFDTTIVRLPGLYGKGLKKNVIFDMLNDNNIENIHKDGVYQYYNLSNIWRDIGVALENQLQIINLATPPVSTAEVARYAFGVDFTNAPHHVNPAYWDMHTKHGSLYGGTDSYICSKQDELEQIKAYVQSMKGR